MRSLLSHFLMAGLLLGSAVARTPAARAENAPAQNQSPREVVRAELARHRAEQLARLQAYADAGQFPHNPDVAPSAHLFRDAAGRYCAVANLVHQDGQDALVAQIVRAQNGLVVADVKDGPLLAWIRGSGLTQEELARIQAPAPFVARPDDDGPMVASIRRHLATVLAELRRDTDASLDLATTRAMPPPQS